MIIVKEVKTKKEQKEFLNLYLDMYKGNKYWCPPLYADEKQIFKKNYFYNNQSESKFWLAYKDGKLVGRISAILQKAANEKWNQKRVRFTRFDCIDDQEVANALFNAVETYAKEKGMEEICGPLGYSDLEREGLLIEGFDWLNTFEEQYNFDYYQRLIENCGFGKDVDWLEHRLTFDPKMLDRVILMGKKLEERTGLHCTEGLSFKHFVKKYKEQFFGMIDKAYDELYGTVPFDKGMQDMIVNNYGAVINMKYLLAVVDKDDKVVGFAISFSNFTEILQKSKGHLYPATIVKLLKEVKHPHKIDLGLIGVDKDSKFAPYIAAIIFGKYAEALKEANIEYLETNLNLEYNDAVIGMWKHFDVIQHKRRRSFIKKI